MAFSWLQDSVFLIPFTALVAAAFGAFCGGAALIRFKKARGAEDSLAVINTSIACMVVLLGKLINFKKDLSFPEEQQALRLEKGEGGKPAPEIWPALYFDSGLRHEKLFACTAADLDIVQLARMLDYNLTELSFFIRQRNALLADGMDTKLYIRTARLIARNVDENLFFLDRMIEKLQAVARRSLPRRLHARIAAFGLQPEARPLMPEKNLIRGWVGK